MKIETINNPELFFKLKPEWNTLLDKSASSSIFLTWEWLYYWWLNFGKNYELFIISARDSIDGTLVGLAPFFKEKSSIMGGMLVEKIKFLGSEKVASDFLDLIVIPGLEKELTQKIFEHLEKADQEWDVIELSDIDGQSRTTAMMKRATKERYRHILMKSQVCPFINLPGNFELLLNSLSPNMRSSLKRKLKQLKEKKSFKLLCINNKNALCAAIDTLFDLHTKRFRARNPNSKRSSSFSGESIKNFHYAVANDFLANDWLKLYCIELNDEIVASLYAFKYKSKLFYYQSGSEPKLGNLGLGTALFGLCIEESIKDGLNEFNFLRGEENYKFRWTKQNKATCKLLIYNRTKEGMLLYCSSIIKESIKRMIAK